MQMNSFKNLTVRNGWVIDKNSKDLALGKSWMVGWFFFFSWKKFDHILIWGRKKNKREKEFGGKDHGGMSMRPCPRGGRGKGTQSLAAGGQRKHGESKL